MKQINLYKYLIAILILGVCFPAQAMEPMEKKAKVEEGDQEELWMQLMNAVNANDPEKVKACIQSGANVNRQYPFPNFYHTTALIRAVDKGYLRIVQCLVESGAELYAEDKFKETALMRAMIMNRMSIFRYLLESGVDVNHKNSNGTTIFMIMPIFPYHGPPGLEYCELCLQYGADYNLRNQNGKTVLDVMNEFIVRDSRLRKIIALLSDPEKIAAVISRRKNNPALEQGFKRITAKHHAENGNVCEALFNRELGIE